jgi:hypothetical protein
MTPSDWLASVSFGEGLRRSVILLRGQFRWYVLLFFVGGVGVSLLLLPIDQNLAVLAERMLAELLNLPPDFLYLGNLVLLDLGLLFVQNFAIALMLFLLACITIHHALRTVPSLGILRLKNPTVLSTASVLKTGFPVAALLAAAGIVVVAVPLLHALLLFTPVIVVAGGSSGLSALRLSAQLRRQHWQRLLCTVIAGLVLTTFAGTLGETLYLNLQAVLSLLHVTPGLLGTLLQIPITQLPVAMVAPTLPLLSLVFYPSAMTTWEDHLRHQLLRRQRQLQQQSERPHITQLEEASPALASRPHATTGVALSEGVPTQDTCSRCGAALKHEARFCHVCGAPLGN